MMIMITIITTIINIVINFHDQQVGGSNENGERKHADDTGQHPCKGGHHDDGDDGGGVHDGDDVVEEAGYVDGHDGEHLKVPAMKERMMIMDDVKNIPKYIAR